MAEIHSIDIGAVEGNLLNLTREPSERDTRIFPDLHNLYEAYLPHTSLTGSGAPMGVSEASLVQLGREVCIWKPACNGLLAVWSIIQARNQMGGAWSKGNLIILGGPSTE
ncbi:hypothetical protein SCLCIDRAFT_10341 [Scleroderma citrinum Foug A]|uniref:Uncharacterized protein n=1 Tax=Scleroderma citrinum Foug A TaxID=1036808 RepID=A0A0C3DPK2_9AGAM|nr:hypothetical protein SCLCIDRAFT_10341 [Scleroderma citrinum Foug A]